MINACELLINAVKDQRLKLLDRALTKRCVAGPSTWRLGGADIQATGEQTVSNPSVLSKGNWVNPYLCHEVRNSSSPKESRDLSGQEFRHLSKRGKLRGRQTVRNADVGAGRRGCKKRRPFCNGADRGLDVIPPERGADLHLVSHGETNQGNTSKTEGGGYRLPSGNPVTASRKDNGNPCSPRGCGTSTTLVPPHTGESKAILCQFQGGKHD